MAVLRYFLGVGPLMHGGRKDIHAEMGGYNSISHTCCAAVLDTTKDVGAVEFTAAHSAQLFLRQLRISAQLCREHVRTCGCNNCALM
jgi:hypothetical protein